MKVKVIKTYVDKYTKNLHSKGEQLDVTKERFAEINGTPLGLFVEAVEEEQKKRTCERKKPPNKTKK